MPRGAARSAGYVIARWTVLVVFAALLAFPFYWMFITTFKQTADLYTLQNNPFKLNMAPTLEHLKLLFGETKYMVWVPTRRSRPGRPAPPPTCSCRCRSVPSRRALRPDKLSG